MRVDRDAAAVVGDGDEAVGLHLDLDEGRVALIASSMALSITSANR